MILGAQIFRLPTVSATMERIFRRTGVALATGVQSASSSAVTSAMSRGGRRASLSTATTQAPTSTTFEKMQADKRYKAESEVPAAVLQSVGSDTVYSPGFSIKGEAKQGRPAYLDFQATTPQDPRVLDAMMPFMVTQYGNPHSRTHSYGWETEAAVEDAREQVNQGDCVCALVG